MKKIILFLIILTQTTVNFAQSGDVLVFSSTEVDQFLLDKTDAGQKEKALYNQALSGSVEDCANYLRSQPLLTDSKAVENRLFDIAATISDCAKAAKLLPNRYADLEDRAYEVVGKDNVIVDMMNRIKEYLEYFPNGSHAPRARLGLEELTLYERTLNGTLQDCNAYISRFGTKGIFYEQVHNRWQFLNELQSNSTASVANSSSSQGSVLVGRIVAWMDEESGKTDNSLSGSFLNAISGGILSNSVKWKVQYTGVVEAVIGGSLKIIVQGGTIQYGGWASVDQLKYEDWAKEQIAKKSGKTIIRGKNQVNFQ